ncbi:glycosyltransferase family 4 protein [bacterium]|nr:glycosyltransferase family 4 protein [bacterium]
MNKRLKICFIGWAYSPHVYRMAGWFARRGHDVHIITDRSYYMDGVKIYVLSVKEKNRTRWERYNNLDFNISWKWLRRANALIRIKKIVQAISPDILHSHSLWYPGYLGSYVNFNPYVVSVFNGDVLWTRDYVSPYEKFRTRRALRRASLVLGESKTLIAAAIKRGGNSERTHVMKLGVDLTKFNRQKDKRKLRKQLALPENANIVLSPRAISEFYNIKTLIKAIPRVIAEIKETFFVFIGFSVNDVYLKELKEEVENLNISKNVLFVGKVNHGQVAKYHQACDVFVSVSPKDSGPIALQEAMACGNVPVISDLPSVRELIADRVNGFLVNPADKAQIADAIIKLLLEDELRKEMAERNWKIAQEKCDQEKEMRKMEELYYKLLKGGRRWGRKGYS